MESGGLAARSRASVWWVAAAAVVGSLVRLGQAEQYTEAKPLTRAVPHALFQPSRVGQLRDGDLVFRAGRDLVSNLVLSQRDRSRYSHVGLLLWQGQAPADMPYVVHAVPADEQGPGGVRLERLDQFAASDVASRVAVLRSRALSAGDVTARLRELRAYALAQLGKPFDDAFAYSDDSQLYCTELVLKALARAGIDVQAVPRVWLPLHEESIALPDDLSQWPGIAEIAVDLGDSVDD